MLRPDHLFNYWDTWHRFANSMQFAIMVGQWYPNSFGHHLEFRSELVNSAYTRVRFIITYCISWFVMHKSIIRPLIIDTTHPLRWGILLSYVDSFSEIIWGASAYLRNFRNGIHQSYGLLSCFDIIALLGFGECFWKGIESFRLPNIRVSPLGGCKMIPFWLMLLSSHPRLAGRGFSLSLQIARVAFLLDYSRGLILLSLSYIRLIIVW